MATKGHDEVKESLREMTRIFKTEKIRKKFVKEYVRKYRIMGGYEEELTHLVELELGKLDSSVS
ncbi:hypothetical protein HMSSN036_89510 [Paenibacillus macerans]|nr:hypothetical protein HMSSN036_89510 [Paenibacillus macerans]